MGRVILLLLAVAAPAKGWSWEGEVGAGIASSNIPTTAPAVNGRLGLTLSHTALSLRALVIPGGDSFSGWMALSELRLHTGEWLGPGRLHLALAAGVGREISASAPPFRDGTPGGVEVGHFGPALLASTGAAIKIGALALSADVAAFWWTNVETTQGTAPVNGGLGAMAVLCVGVLP